MNSRMLEALDGTLAVNQLSVSCSLYSWDLRCIFSPCTTSACDLSNNHFSLAGLSQVILLWHLLPFFYSITLWTAYGLSSPRNPVRKLVEQGPYLYLNFIHFAKCFLWSFFLLNLSIVWPVFSALLEWMFPVFDFV